MADELKYGRRNAARDQEHLNKALDHLIQAGGEHPWVHPEPDADDRGGPSDGDADNKSLSVPADALVFDGSAVKALGDGRVGGYLVRFSTAKDADLTGDFFTAKTDFGDHTTAPVIYHHGLDGTLKGRVLGTGTLKRDDVGVWVEAQLKLRDEYEREIYRLAEAGKLGWSSGTAAHLVERVPAGKAHEIKRWPLGLDASLTPTPAEPRNAALTLKSIAGTPGQAGPDGSPADKFATVNIHTGDANMDAEVKAQLDAMNAFIAEQKAAKEAAEREKVIEAKAREIAEARIEAELAKRGVPVKVDPARMAQAEMKTQEVRKTGEYKAAFTNFLRTGDDRPFKALFESQDTAGGFLVPEEWQAEILKKLPGLTALYRLARKVPTSRDTMVLFKRNYTTDNKYTAGARLTWTGDVPASATTARVTSNSYAQARIPVYVGMMTELVYKSVLEDAVVNVEADLRDAFTVNMAQDLENYFVNGTGANQPYGLVKDTTLIAGSLSAGSAAFLTGSAGAAKLKALYYALPAQYRKQAVWMFNSNEALNIASLVDANGRFIWDSGQFGGGLAVMQPDGAVEATPMLMGRPVYISEHFPNSGTGVFGSIVFGDPTGYVVAERVGMSIVRLEELYAETDAVGFVLRVRYGGQVVEDYKFKGLAYT